MPKQRLVIEGKTIVEHSATIVTAWKDRHFKLKTMFGIKFRKQTEKEELSFIIRRLDILKNNYELGSDIWWSYHMSTSHLKELKEKL